jgi:recombination protein RecT
MKPMDQIKLKIDGIQKQIAVSIPATMQKYLTPERLTRLFWQEARRNPKLLECSPESVASGLMTAAQLGLEIGVQGQAWLVPYWNKKQKRLDAQFIPGYKGLIALARRSGEVLSVETHIVYEKDKFALKLGINTSVEHEPYLEGDRGLPRLTYGVARFKDGGYHFEWMPEVEIRAIRARSQAAESGPWVTDTDQMRRKTVIRRMSNYLPQSIEFANALTVDDAVNSGNKAVIAGQFVEIDEGAGLEALPEHAGGEAAPLDSIQQERERAQVGKSTAGVNKQTGEIEFPLDSVRRICADATAMADKALAYVRLDDARFEAKDLTGGDKAEADQLISNAAADIDGKQ